MAAESLNSHGIDHTARWEEFGDEIDVEVRICPNFIGRVKGSDKAVLERLVAGTEAEHLSRPRTVLMRQARTAKRLRGELLQAMREELDLGESQGENEVKENKNEESGNHVVAIYSIEVPVKIPSRFLNQPLALEASINTQAYRSHNHEPSTLRTGGLEAEVQRVFRLSRVATDALPPRAVETYIRVIQPLKIETSQAPATVPQATILSIQIENSHPTAVLTLHNLDLHLGNTSNRNRRRGSEYPLLSKGPIPPTLPHSTPGPKLSRNHNSSTTPLLLHQQPSIDGMEPVKCGSDSNIDLVGLFQVCWLNSNQFPLNLEPGDKYNFVAKVSAVPDQQNVILEKLRKVQSLCTPLTEKWSAGAVEITAIHSVTWTAPTTAEGNVVLQVSGPYAEPTLNSVTTLCLTVKNWTKEIRKVAIRVDDINARVDAKVSGVASGSRPIIPSLSLNRSQTQSGQAQFVPLESYIDLGLLQPRQEKSQEIHLIPLVKGIIEVDCLNVWDFSYQRLFYPEHPFFLTVS